MFFGSIWLTVVGAFWAMFSYVGDIISAAFKATETVVEGKRAAQAVEGGGVGVVGKESWKMAA